MCEWVSAIIKTETIHSFSDVESRPQIFSRLCEALKLDPEKEKHPYAKNKEITVFADFLASFWKDKYNIDIFSYFDAFFRRQYNASFRFVDSFTDIIHSDTTAVIFVLLMVCLLTFLNVAEDDS